MKNIMFLSPIKLHRTQDVIVVSQEVTSRDAQLVKLFTTVEARVRYSLSQIRGSVSFLVGFKFGVPVSEKKD